MLTTRQLLLLALGLLVVAAPLALGKDDEYYDEEEGEDDVSGGDVNEADVVVITAKNFDSIVKKHKFVLVEFYAPWCGHCKALAPEYAKAATALKSYDADVVIGKVDATQEESLAKQFGVEGYPTLKWFVNGEAMEYSGGRDEKTIVSWVKKKTGPPAATAATTADLEKAEKDADVTVLGYFAAFEGEAFDAFISMAQKTDGIAFIQTTSADVAAAKGLTSVGVAVTKAYSFEAEKSTATSGPISTLEALEAFVSANKMPLVVPFSQKTTGLIFESGIEVQIMYIGDTETLVGEPYETYKTVAKEFAGKLVFVSVNSDEKKSSPVTEFFGVSEEAPRPVVMGFSVAGGGGKKFKIPGDYNLENLKAFAQSMVDGTAQQEFKSAPIPENNKEGDVTVVVGKSFDDIVLDETKDVLLEVYAPWCGHCKQLEPIYKKLAKRFKKVDSVVIAKMDGTENEHAMMEVEGFPTIKFFPAGGKEPISMDSERTLAAMTKFIKKHATIPYELPKKKGDDGEGAHEEL